MERTWMSLPIAARDDTVEPAEGDGGNQRRLSASGAAWSTQLCKAARAGQSDPNRILDPEGKADAVTITSWS